MPWQNVPGQRGTTWRPASETFADPDYDITYDREGNPVAASKKPGRLWKALPYIIGGGMGYGALANAGVFGSALAGKGVATGAATGGMNQALPPAISALGGVGGGTGIIPPTGGGGGGGNGFWRGARNVARNVVGNADGFNPWQQAALAALAGLPGLLANRGMSDEEKAIYAQLQQDLEQDRQMRDLTRQRYQMQGPLAEAVTRLAMNRLPTDVQAPIEGL